jgi:DNA-directed RNA polymerase subunit M/transcription elongation factor TFIIS
VIPVKLITSDMLSQRTTDERMNVVLKAMCPKCGNALVVTAAGTLRQHGSCGSVPVEKAAGTVEVNRKSKPKAAVKRTPAKRVAKKAQTRKVPARRK